MGTSCRQHAPQPALQLTGLPAASLSRLAMSDAIWVNPCAIGSISRALVRPLLTVNCSEIRIERTFIPMVAVTSPGGAPGRGDGSDAVAERESRGVVMAWPRARVGLQPSPSTQAAS